MAEAREITAVLLAGTIRPTPLRAAVGVPTVCLPVGDAGSVLHAWWKSLRTVDGLARVIVVVNSSEDVASVTQLVERDGGLGFPGAKLEVIVEPASWRGAGGILRDVTEGLDEAQMVLAGEASVLPPTSLAPLVEVMGAEDAGAVGIGPEDEPTGISAFRRGALMNVPTVGYHDLKEQLLPKLAERGAVVRAARFEHGAQRMRDRAGYLEAVACSLRAVDHAQRVSSGASISGSAILDGFCIIEPGAVVEDGAVVHEAVVMSGATISGGAVVTQSVVAPLGTVTARERVIRNVVGGRGSGRRRDRVSQRTGSRGETMAGR